MAFSAFASSGSPFAAAGIHDTGGTTGPVTELVEISTEAIGFQALAGEAKVRLVPQWPSTSLPPPTASLLSVANGKGLLAAAGPDSVVIATTDAVRQAFQGPGEDKIKPLTPQLTLNLGMRISQLSFSANEEFLVLSAENGGGLAIYEVSALLQSKTQPAFEVATNGTALRAMLPNPKSETAEYVAVVTVHGQLMVADLKSRQFVSGTNGQVLRENVSTAAWSNKGKQIVAGLGNGACVQMTPDGQVKAEISVPGDLGSEHMVSSLNWLENDVFLTAHTPPSGDTSGMIPATIYHIITRAKSPQNTFSYSKLPELSPPFGLGRIPAFQFISRLRQFPPSLEDVIVLVSTASADVSVITRSKTPLSKEVPENQIVNTYTSTLMADDAKRASLPMNDALSDTSPVGVIFDLSSKDKVKKPIPGEEFDESPHPLPALLVLNNEGILSAWWFVYADSIRQKTVYPGLANADTPNTQQGLLQQTSSPAKAPQAFGSTFGQPSFGQTPKAGGLFGSLQNQTNTSPFAGGGSAGSAFGTTSGLGTQSSPWSSNTNSTTTGTAFGQSSFGAPSKIGGTPQGSAFGSTSGLGNKASPWGSSSATPTAAGPTFGQTAQLGKSSSPFATASSNSGAGFAAPASGGFASFAKSSGFSAAPSTSGGSLFGKPASTSPFGTQTASSAFAAPSSSQAQNPFNTGAFKLGSTFQSDGSAQQPEQTPSESRPAPLFGGGFGAALGEAANAQPRDADMSDGQGDSTPVPAIPNKEVQTSKPIPSGPPFGSARQPENGHNDSGQLFGKSSSPLRNVSKPTDNQTARFTFASAAPKAEADEDNGSKTGPAAPEVSKAPSKSSPKVKEEPTSDDSLSDHSSLSSLGEPQTAASEASRKQRIEASNQDDESTDTPTRSPSSPLPPESTSKTVYAAGDSSSSSKFSEDAPLPPDFVPQSSQKAAETQPDQNQLPHDSEGESESFEQGVDDTAQSGTLDDEGSGVDLGQELSPASSEKSSKAASGVSSSPARSNAPESNLFSPQPPSSHSSKPTKPNSLFATASKQPLFGESGKPKVPLFASGKSPESPRSPSPVRKEPNSSGFRPGNSRSVTFPNVSLIQGNASARIDGASAPSQVPLQHSPAGRQENSSQFRLRDHLAEQRSQVLTDDEDDYTRSILSSEVAPSRTLDNFIAHQDYVSDGVKPGIPGQIEKMFRDINSMIDTLGLNSRSLIAFTKGHQTSSNDYTPGQKDLNNLDEWCLVDVEELNLQEDELLNRLDQQKIQAVPDKLADIEGVRQSLASLRRQSHEIGRIINETKNPTTSQSNAQKQLNLDQQAQLKDIRSAFGQFQKQLADAEQAIVLLRTKISSQVDSTRSNGKPKIKQPTVEAVEKTIRKMTALISQKGEDIDDLSLQLGDLRMSTSPGSNAVLNGSDLRTSNQGSPPYSSPRFRSSRRSLHPYQQSPLRGNSSINGAAAGASEYFTAEEKEMYQARRKTRQEVNEMVKGVFGGGQLKVISLD